MALPFVGVDVVDRSAPRAVGKSGDRRFLERVFTAAERERIRGADDPDGELWTLWAAKEAAFKVVTKLAPGIPSFRHIAFGVTDPPGEPVRHLVHEGTAVGLDAHVEAGRVMVWAWNGPAPEMMVARATVAEALESLGVSESREEWQSDWLDAVELEAVHGLASALVRAMAKLDAARMLGVDVTTLSIVCESGHTGLRPPYLHSAGIRLEGADVSLSHDGAELAWAIRVR